MALALAILSLPWLALAQEKSDQSEPVKSWDLRNRLSAGLVYERGTEDGLELLLRERLSYKLSRPAAPDIAVNLAGWTGIRLLEGRLDDTRIHQVNLAVDGAHWSLDVGRFAPPGGAFRLVDGLQMLHEVGNGVRLGGWAGLSPDPYTTAPALRFGGGPLLTWTNAAAQVQFLGEILGGAAGLDRLSAVVAGQYQAGRKFESTMRIDVQYGGPGTPVVPADAAIYLVYRPEKAFRIDGLYDAYSSLSYLWTAKRDPAITRFADRSTFTTETPDIPQDQMDPTMYHLAGLSIGWVPSAIQVRPTVRLMGRYRHHTERDRRYARTTALLGVLGLFDERLEISNQSSLFWLGDAARAQTELLFWLEPDPARLVALDWSAQIGAPLGGSESLGPDLYADFFVDLLIPLGIIFSGGYYFAAESEAGWWDPMHGAMLRVTWRQRAGDGR